MFELKNISVTIRGKKILDNVSCTIEKNDLIVVIGHNGAGKTTLFDCISGKIQPTSGSIFFNGKNITYTSERERSLYLGRLFQNPQRNGVSVMTVRENLCMSLYKGQTASLTHGTPPLPQELLTKLIDLSSSHTNLLETRMGNLSGGQRQLIAFLMATVYQPSIMLLDEPTAALDPIAATKLLENALQTAYSGITTLIITHDPHLALTVGNKLWILENGTITKQYHQVDKAKLSEDDLLGKIDYERLKKIA